MRSRLAALAALILALLTLALVPTPAAALSCVGGPRPPVELLRGAPLFEHPRGDPTLFESHDHVVVGRVTAVRPPAATPPQHTGHPVSVDIDVLTVFNRTTTPAVVTVTMGDHGEMTGYAFEVGKEYFVAVGADDSYGICGPTTALSDVDPDPARAVGLLQAAARASGVPFAVPAAAGTPAQTVSAPAPARPGPGSSHRGPAAAVAAGSAAAVMVGIVGLFVVRRLRPASPDATRETAGPST